LHKQSVPSDSARQFTENSAAPYHYHAGCHTLTLALHACTKYPTLLHANACVTCITYTPLKTTQVRLCPAAYPTQCGGNRLNCTFCTHVHWINLKIKPIRVLLSPPYALLAARHKFPLHTVTESSQSRLACEQLRTTPQTFRCAQRGQALLRTFQLPFLLITAIQLLQVFPPSEGVD
jgi:hypothetical protein